MKRWVKVLLIVLAVIAFVVFVLPLLIPLPSIGVAAETLADDGGYFVDVNGLSTYVLEAGPSDGPVVLLVHGFGGSTFSWREQMDVLAEAGYRAVAFDRPPYGLSAKTGDLPLTQEEQAEFTAGLMDMLAIDSATLVGHSMGGGVIGQFAALYPERVDALGFVDGAPAVGEGGSSAAGGAASGAASVVNGILGLPPIERWARLIVRAVLTPEAFTGILASAYYDPAVVTPEVAAGYQRQLRVMDWDQGLINLFSGSGGGFAPLDAEQLEAFTMPIAIFWGE
ncbi:MAG TPA: alpha/beta hydrolase, partial [Candidatus Limnocylindrales bacterium]|nr:alpha/beta hydrolase [Candidatus Limnocylindrales bacterium]